MSRSRSVPRQLTSAVRKRRTTGSGEDLPTDIRGDRRITDYARRWRHALPRRVALARLGANEFAICIVGERPEVINKLLNTIRQTTPAVSVDTVTQSSSDANIAALYAQADAALYQKPWPGPSKTTPTPPATR